MGDNADQYADEKPDANDLQAWFDSDPILAQAQRDGIDVWALWANIHRPVEELIRRHQIALNRFKMLYNAANK